MERRSLLRRRGRRPGRERRRGLLAGAAGALTHLDSVAAGRVLTSASIGALPVWAPRQESVPAALVADSLTLSLAKPDVVLSRSAANRLLLGGMSLLQFGGTTNASTLEHASENDLYLITTESLPRFRDLSRGERLGDLGSGSALLSKFKPQASPLS